MNKLKVINVDSDKITFEDGVTIYSDHGQDCCESHELDLNDITLKDFEGLEFDLTNENFFKRIEGYGIELIPINGRSIRIAGHGYNNGYYSDNLDLIIEKDGKIVSKFDISECQDIDG